MKTLETLGLIIFILPMLAAMVAPFMTENSEQAFVIALLSMVPCSYLSIKAIDSAN
jgi:hypothetical protein